MSSIRKDSYEYNLNYGGFKECPWTSINGDNQLDYMNGNLCPEYYYKDVEILFSTEVNALAKDEKEGQSSTALFTNNYETMIETVIQTALRLYTENPFNDYSINNQIGCYISDNGDVFEEKSFSLSFSGISPEVAVDIGQLICLIFKQEATIVKVGKTVFEYVKYDDIKYGEFQKEIPIKTWEEFNVWLEGKEKVERKRLKKIKTKKKAIKILKKTEKKQKIKKIEKKLTKKILLKLEQEKMII